MNILLIIQDTLKIAESTTNKEIVVDNHINWWFWISITEFMVIVFLILKTNINKKYTLKQKHKQRSLKQNIDFDNIINSSFNSDELYDELKVKCHPDRFPYDSEKNNVADKLFQQINKNQNNVKRLLELKVEAIEKLNIKF